MRGSGWTWNPPDSGGFRMDAYELHEGRFVQELHDQGAPDGLTVGSAVYATPEGKVRTVLAARLFPDAAETRQVWIGKGTRSGKIFPLSIPYTVALSPSIFYPLVTEGMEIKLYPGEFLQGHRDAATAGSAMNMDFQFIESDLPFYAYDDPQNRVVKSVQKHGSVFRSTGGISTGGAGAADRSSGRSGREGGGRAEPV